MTITNAHTHTYNIQKQARATEDVDVNDARERCTVRPVACISMNVMDGQATESRLAKVFFCFMGKALDSLCFFLFLQNSFKKRHSLSPPQKPDGFRQL
jgi:hypothetical protein